MLLAEEDFRATCSRGISPTQYAIMPGWGRGTGGIHIVERMGYLCMRDKSRELWGMLAGQLEGGTCLMEGDVYTGQYLCKEHLERIVASGEGHEIPPVERPRGLLNGALTLGELSGLKSAESVLGLSRWVGCGTGLARQAMLPGEVKFTALAIAGL